MTTREDLIWPSYDLSGFSVNHRGGGDMGEVQIQVHIFWAISSKMFYRADEWNLCCSCSKVCKAHVAVQGYEGIFEQGEMCGLSQDNCQAAIYLRAFLFQDYHILFPPGTRCINKLCLGR